LETKNKNIKTFNQHLDKRYSETGTKERTDFEIKAKSFAIGELIKEERKLNSPK
jgi:hypothetical protein